MASAEVEELVRSITNDTPGNQLRLAADLLDESCHHGNVTGMHIAKNLIERVSGELTLVLFKVGRG
jgi:hypothetical protein